MPQRRVRMNGGQEVPAVLRRAIAGAVMFGLVAGTGLVVAEPATAGSRTHCGNPAPAVRRRPTSDGARPVHVTLRGHRQQRQLPSRTRYPVRIAWSSKSRIRLRQ